MPSSSGIASVPPSSSGIASAVTEAELLLAVSPVHSAVAARAASETAPVAAPVLESRMAESIVMSTPILVQPVPVAASSLVPLEVLMTVVTPSHENSMVPIANRSNLKTAREVRSIWKIHNMKP